MGNLNVPLRRAKRDPRKEVKLPEDCWFDVLKCLPCPLWSKMRYVCRQINSIAERNIWYLPRSIIDMAIFDGNYPKPKLSRKLPKTKDTLVAYGAIIPHSEIKQWFVNRLISLDTPNDIPVEEILIGRNYVKLGSMDMCILGPGNLNSGMRLFEYSFRKQKFYESVVFYGRFHPSTKFSLAYLEQFLLFLFHPLSYVKVVEMYAVNQNFIDAVKAKFADDFSVQQNLAHTPKTNNNNQLYIRCKTFKLPTVAKQIMCVNDFNESLKWLQRNVRADSICISPKTYDYHPEEQNEICRLIKDFVFGASRMCARREIRLYSNIETKLLTSLVEKFWTLPQIESKIPTVVIYSFPDFDREKLNLGPNWILLEVDSEGAEFLHVLENGHNRMRISFCENLDDRWTIGSYKRNCYIKLYAIKSSDIQILSIITVL